jgi:hypothetical protein
MQVTVISNKHDKAVIQWVEDGTTRRGVIPSILVNGDHVDDSALSLAVPYGIDWESVLDGHIRTVSVAEYAAMFRGRGVWTTEDLRRDPQCVIGVILSASGLDFQTVLRLVEQSPGGKHG